MKKTVLYQTIIAIIFAVHTHAQTTITGNAAEKLISGAEIIRINKSSEVPAFVQFRKGAERSFDGFENWFHSALGVSSSCGLKLISTENDKLGMVHYRYSETINGKPILGTMYIVHTKNNKVVSMNGFLFKDLKDVATVAGMSESAALSIALSNSNAELYRWQMPAHEKEIKEATKNPHATFFPKGELMYAPVKGIYKENNYRLAYRFDIYSEQPLKRNYVFVDALSGEILFEKNRIEESNVPATGITSYSGARPMMTDNFAAGTYRLQETGRGNGIITYNNLTATAPTGTTDFTNSTTTWHNVNAQLDEYAPDAHWGAEKTYDFYDSVCNRNSIDGLGFALISYVHVRVNYVNAFWDGDEMNYGDGNATYTPLTSIDITGHEIAHGLTEFTSNLGNVPEGGAMNEGFSDCMGVSIRQFALNSGTMDWYIGDLIGGTPFRDMANPNSLSNPDTYFGQYWDSTTNEVHQNSTVFSHAFYLTAVGGSGTNDHGSVYNVSAIGLDKAIQIWFRMNTIYLNQNSDYAEARTYAIQAAADLYGSCSPEAITVTNAWYAVGVGAEYVIGPTVCNFIANQTSYCTLPATVNFTNTTTNGGGYTWYFGDGDTSSVVNPSHIYTIPGTFTVKLIANSTCGIDSLISTNYITVNPLPSPTAVSPININCGTSAILNATGPNLNWFDSPSAITPLDTGATYTTPILNSSTTYYVQSIVSSPGDFNTPLDNTLGAGANNNYSHYLVFNVNSACTLVSVLVYANGAGNRTITLNNSSGTVLNTATINIPAGQSRITLNFPMIVGNNYQLACITNPNMYRNSAGASYPYSDALGLVTITGNDVPDPARYYFFYNWELTPAPCTSAAIPVVVNVAGGVTPAFSEAQAGTTVTFTNTSTGTISYTWHFGDGTTDTTTSPVHNYTANGTYTITLIATNGTCTDSTTQTIIINNVGINESYFADGISIYPNPSSGEFIVESSKFKIQSIKIFNVLGEVIYHNSVTLSLSKGKSEINLGSFDNGIYFIELQSKDKKVMRKIVKE